MIKLIIFDLDGVLADLKEIHYESLNKALVQHYLQPISREDHISKYDGLSTDKKLDMYRSLTGLSLASGVKKGIKVTKQCLTLEGVEKLKVNHDLCRYLEQLKCLGYALAVASNAITPTVFRALNRLDITCYFSSVFTNQDVGHLKPNPQIYLRTMETFGVSPRETMIVEDSKAGRQAAVVSGAHVCGVDNPDDLIYTKKLFRSIERANKEEKPIRWAGKSDTTVLIPMAGAGSRFKEAGYSRPKPLIDVNGKPMIQRVVENLNIDANFVFVVQREHYFKWDINYLLNLIAPGCKIVLTNGLTEGAACTTLLAKEFINNDDHLLIANSDQLLEWDSCDFFYNMLSSGVDGGIVTFRDTDPKWSFAKVEDGFVVETAEKIPISDIATSGVYWWNKGSDYVKYAEERIAQNTRHNGEFYVCPTFNNLIADGGKVKTYDIKRMWGVGTPDDLRAFLRQNDFCPT